MSTAVNRSEYSKLQELIIEHLFVGEGLRSFWRCGVTDVEVTRSEIDTFGYDLVMGRGEVVRHIQLKPMEVGASTRKVAVSLKLMLKPSGCVVWIMVDPTSLEMKSFLWFGGAPGERLPDINNMKVTEQTRGPVGAKKLRTGHRDLPLSKFDKLKTLNEVLVKLFGELPEGMSLQ
jgi:hypothetical protein